MTKKIAERSQAMFVLVNDVSQQRILAYARFTNNNTPQEQQSTIKRGSTIKQCFSAYPSFVTVRR